MAIVTVACPKCQKTFRSKEDVKGKRIRCPSCSLAFVVEKFAGEDEPQPAKSKPAPPPSQEEDEDANPYGVQSSKIVPRCPNCANEMENETAIICLYCGYNTQTRTLGKTRRVVQLTGSDKFMWLLPGIGCVLALMVLVLLHNYYILNLGASFRADDWWLYGLLFSEPAYLWLTLFAAGGIWFVGRIAFKRLILEPTPPEDVAD
jgi:DNA-directed RNA polymerase subunit RPC12/RpoP